MASCLSEFGECGNKCGQQSGQVLCTYVCWYMCVWTGGWGRVAKSGEMLRMSSDVEMNDLEVLECVLVLLI